MLDYEYWQLEQSSMLQVDVTFDDDRLSIISRVSVAKTGPQGFILREIMIINRQAYIF